MNSKLNKKKRKNTINRQDFFYGSVKGEIKKVTGLWNRVTSKTGAADNQIDTVISRKICAPIPANQELLAAIARGEKPERGYFDSMLKVRII